MKNALTDASRVSLTIAKSANDRILIVDALRGVCLVLMTIGHLPENPLWRIANVMYGPFGLFTAASGFVFLCGWVAGRVYGARRQKYGARLVNRHLLSRFIKLHSAQLVLILGFGLPSALHLNIASRLHLDLFDTHPLKAFLMAVFLFYQAGGLGILPMYLFFVLLTPLLLWQLQTGHAWRVLACSSVIWAASGLVIGLPHNPAWVYFEFNPLGYQIIFVCGVIIGQKGLGLSSMACKVRRFVVATSFALTASFFLLFCGYAFFEPMKPSIDPHMLSLFSLGNMGPLRLLNSAVFSITLCWIGGQISSVKLNSFFFNWLTLLGQNSLAVFTWSIASSAIIAMVGLQNSSRPLRVAIMFLDVISLSIPVLLESTVGTMKQRFALYRAARSEDL